MRWVYRILGLLVLLIVLGIGGLMLIPSGRIAKLAAEQFQAATGRAMVISGKVSPTLWPRLGVTTGAVQIANASWSKNGPMLTAKGLDIGIDVMALIHGDIRISKVEVLSPSILLERRKDGHGNWEFQPPSASAAQPAAPQAAPAASGSGGMQAFSLDKGIIKNGSVTWIDHATGQAIKLTAIDATLTIPSFTGPAKLDLTAKANGQPIRIAGSLGIFGDFMAGKVVPAKLTADIGKSKIGFDGNLGTAPVQAQGALDADLVDPSALAAILGQAAPALPKGLGRDHVAAKGQVTLAKDGSMHLRDGKVTLDSNQMTVAADVTFPKGTPDITAQIDAGALDLSGLTSGGGAAPAKTSGGGSGGGGAAKTVDGWSTAPIDASGLKAVNAEVALSAGSVNLGVAKLGRTRGTVTLKDGRAVVDLKQVSAYGGSITGQAVVNGRSGLSTAADLTVSGIAMQPLLQDFAGYNRLVGTGDMKMRLQASGNSEAALVQSLSGQGSVHFGKGEIRGLDLVGMLRTMNTSYMGPGSKTIFDTIGASFTIQKGVLSNNDLTFVAPLLTATGKGTVDIAHRQMNYTVTPTALKKADGTGGISVPLNITGAWAHPKFGLDVKALANQQLKEKAKSELQKKANEALGLPANSGGSTQDQVKQKLQDEAKKGLLNLLNGNK